MSDPNEPREVSGTIVAAVLLVLMVAGAFYRYWPSDERDIKRHLSNLAEALSIPATDTEVERITRFAALREYFAPDVRVRVGAMALDSRDAVIAALEAWKPAPGGLTVEAVDIAVALNDDNEHAQVTLTAKASQSDPANRQSMLEERHGTLSMRKADGDWVIAAADFTTPAR